MRAGRGAAGSGSTCGAASSGRDRHQNLHFFTHGAGTGRVPDAGGEPSSAASAVKEWGKSVSTGFHFFFPSSFNRYTRNPCLFSHG